MSPTRELYDIKDLTEILPWSKSKIEEFRDKGVLEMSLIGGKWVCNRNQLNRFIQKIEVDPHHVNSTLNAIF